MCNCGRRQPTEVVTSAQVQADIAERQAQDAAHQEEIFVASASNALANASSGWVAHAAE